MTPATVTSVLEGAERAEPRRCSARRRRWFARPSHYRAVDNLRTAILERDVARVEMLLHPGAGLVVDSGSETGSGKRAFLGAHATAVGLLHGANPGVESSLDVRSVNGQAGLVLRARHINTAVICVDFTAGLVSVVWVRLQPEQLKHWNHI